MPGVEFTVPGVVGQRRPRFTSVCGHGQTYKAPEDRERERLIASSFLVARTVAGLPGEPASGAIRVRIVCSKPLPKSAPKGQEWASYVVKPDADNVAKSVLDALNGVAWFDDAQVTELSVIKVRRTRECAEETKVVVQRQ